MNVLEVQKPRSCASTVKILHSFLMEVYWMPH